MKNKQIIGIVAILMLMVIPLGLSKNPEELHMDCSLGSGYMLDACVDGNEHPNLEGKYCLCYGYGGHHCEIVDGEPYGC